MAGIYIHIPFCNKKCPYCDFYSIKMDKNKSFQEIFIDALFKEILLKKHLLKSKINTIYIGGGTPSIMPIEFFSKLKNILYQNFDLSVLQEVTLEINPEHATEEFFKELKELNFVNRLSTGFQAMHKEGLTFLKRNHSLEDNFRYFLLCKKYSFDNYSVDYIFGYQGLTIEQIENALDIFIENKVPHISCYGLGIEPNTLFYKQLEQNLISKIDDEEFFEQFKFIDQKLEKAGYIHYEISNYSLKNKHSIHNSNYWNFTEYLGFGPSAHSYVDNSRFYNVNNLFKYAENVNNSILFEQKEDLSTSDMYNEFIMLSFRQKKGVEIQKLSTLFPKNVNNFFKNVNKSSLKQYFIEENGFIRLNLEGIFISDFIIEQFFV